MGTKNKLMEGLKQILFKKYVNEGVLEDKITITEQPIKLPLIEKQFVGWSLSRKRLFGENGIDALEFIDDGNGNKRLSLKNNVWITMSHKTNLTKEDVDEINNSNGIVCAYYSEGFMYGFIPS